MAVQKYDIRTPSGAGGDFQVRYWSPVNSPILDQQRELAYIVHQVEDVTDLVLLQEHGSEQHAEIVRRSQELQEVNGHLRTAVEEKHELLTRLGHELSAPLAAISGFGELLLQNVPSEDQRQWAAMISKASTHLGTMVDEALDLTRIESGQLAIALESVEVEPLLEEAVALTRPLMISSEVEIETSPAGPKANYVLADKQRLTQVVVNLVANAVKFTPQGGVVRLAVEQPGGDRVRIAIADGGEGVSEQMLEQIFVPFVRPRSGGEHVGDTGLGLALSRRLVEAMSGTVEAASLPGDGTTFTIELGRGEPAAIQHGVSNGSTPVAARAYAAERRLLYIEDGAANIRLIERILEARPSVRLVPATLGEVGVQLAQEERPDLILLDLDLPDITGEEVLALLRADLATREIPIVVLTEDANRHRDPVLAAGVEAYLTKPIDVHRLLEVVDTSLAGTPSA